MIVDGTPKWEVYRTVETNWNPQGGASIEIAETLDEVTVGLPLGQGSKKNVRFCLEVLSSEQNCVQSIAALKRIPNVLSSENI